jgi:hypothetical protein
MMERKRTRKQRQHFTEAEWIAEARARFGDNPNDWAFRCPACRCRITVGDYRRAGAPEDTIAFSCIGRFNGKGGSMEKPSKFGCNYAGGGLFRLNPVDVIREDGKTSTMFAFAKRTKADVERCADQERERRERERRVVDLIEGASNAVR